MVCDIQNSRADASLNSNTSLLCKQSIQPHTTMPNSLLLRRHFVFIFTQWIRETTILQQLCSGKDRQIAAAVSPEAVLLSLKEKYSFLWTHHWPEAKDCEFIHLTITCAWSKCSVCLSQPADWLRRCESKKSLPPKATQLLYYWARISAHSLWLQGRN